MNSSNGKPKHLIGDAERREAAAAKPVPSKPVPSKPEAGKPEAGKPMLGTPATPSKPDVSKPAPSHSVAADIRASAKPETPPASVAHPPSVPPVSRVVAPPEPAAVKPVAPPSPPAVIAAPPEPAVAAPPPPEPKPAVAREERVAAAEDPWSSFAATQAAFARGFEEVAGEMTGMTRLGMAATADAALALLGARTFAEAVEINAGLAQRGLGVMIEGSARLSEIGVKAVTAASRPILSRFGGAWSGPFTR